jgi:hypothetical protein
MGATCHGDAGVTDGPEPTIPGQVGSPGVGARPSNLRAESVAETAIREAYGEAVKGALESRDGTCGAIITASLSIVTAYTAVITLVTPKSQQPLLTTLIPYVLLSVAFISAAIGKLAGVPVGKVLERKSTKYSHVGEFVTNVYERKFWAASVAIAFAALGVLSAGYSLAQLYAHTIRLADSTTVSVVYLNQQGTALVAAACGTPMSELTGAITITDGFVDVALRDPAPCLGSPTVGVPVSAVGFIRADP